VILASSFSFLEVFWTILIFFGFVFWLMILFNVVGDIFRRHDITGWGKVLWLIGIILLPYLGVFIYLIVEHEGLVQRSVNQQQAAQSQFGAADPHRRRDERVEALGHHTREVVAEQRVGGERHMRAVLLRGAKRDDDGVAPALLLCLDLRPGHAIQLDCAHASLLSRMPPRV
jgi:hypothetical protein